LKTVILFEKSKFVLRVALEAFKPAISEAVSSFKAHTDLLSELLRGEVFASVQEIKDEQVETLSKSIRWSCMEPLEECPQIAVWRQ